MAVLAGPVLYVRFFHRGFFKLEYFCPFGAWALYLKRRSVLSDIPREGGLFKARVLTFATFPLKVLL